QPPSPVKMRNPLGWWWHTPHDLIDKIDEAFLARDTRIVVASLWHLLTNPLLPLDYASHAAKLRDELRTIAPRLRGVLAMDGLVEAAESLRQKAQAVASLGAGSDDARLERLNLALMQVSRALVPLDYTRGDRFSHDPALPQPAWPALQALRDL